jgi:polyhydroxyalkanoate synthesis regulator phasin
MSTQDNEPGVFEKAFLLGLGAFSMSKEKADEIVDDLVSRGRMDRGEGTRFAEWMSKRGAEQAEAFRRTVRDEAGKAMDAAGLATKDDVEALKAEIAELKDMLSRSGDPGSSGGDAGRDEA